MARKPVFRMTLTPVAALRIVRRIAGDSAAVYFTTHASQRMRQRRITRAQVLHCLAGGRITEGPAPDTTGRWCVTLQRYCAGDLVNVVASLDWDADASDYLLVITVFGD